MMYAGTRVMSKRSTSSRGRLTLASVTILIMVYLHRGWSPSGWASQGAAYRLLYTRFSCHGQPTRIRDNPASVEVLRGVGGAFSYSCGRKSLAVDQSSGTGRKGPQRTILRSPRIRGLSSIRLARGLLTPDA